MNSRTENTSIRPRTGRPRTATSMIGGYQQIVCAVTESRGISATVGLCFVNLTTGECVLSEICDSQTYVRTMHKLSVFDPTEILVPSTAVTPRKSTLLSIMEHYLTRASITQVPRGYYSEKLGHDYVQQLAFTDDIAGIKVAVSAKFYAMSAAAAALKYIELSYMRFSLNSLRIKYQGSEGSMLIDFSTVYSLELIQNIQSANSTNCLFGLLNNTLTAMGARLLRSNILQPLTDLSTINSRLDALEEFTQHEEMFFQTRMALKPILDIDRLLTALCNIDRIEPAQSLINGVINEDVTFSKSPLDLRNQRCYAVKSGVNGLLDVARQTYKEATEDVHSLVQELSQEHDLPLELKFETGRGYYMRLPASEIEDRALPDVFVNVVGRKRILELTTLELVKRNAKIADSLTEVLLMSDKTVQQLVEDVRKEISVLYKVCEGIAMLDMIVSFAHLCTVQDYVRPEFTDTLAIKAGRHPIREKFHKDRFVPNDIYASQQSRQVLRK
ncbi:MutS protein msh4 [Rhizina undulata]